MCDLKVVRTSPDTRETRVPRVGDGSDPFRRVGSEPFTGWVVLLLPVDRIPDPESRSRLPDLTLLVGSGIGTGAGIPGDCGSCGAVNPPPLGANPLGANPDPPKKLDCWPLVPIEGIFGIGPVIPPPVWPVTAWYVWYKL